MSESKKTLVFVAVAAVVAIGAAFSFPRQQEVRVGDKVGEMLAAEFSDPLAAKSLEITRFDETFGEFHTFKVAHVNGQWRIPSHSNYPADAANQLRDAATGLVDLKILGVASEVESDHKKFGVVEPDPDKGSRGEEGVGLLVSMEDEKGDDLISLIIGKQVKGADDQRYVRIPGKSPVFVVTLNPEKLSTKFEDWIEKDLLQLNSFDVQNLRFKDYSASLNGNVVNLQRRSEAAVSFQSDKGEWVLDELLMYRNDDQAVPTSLLPNEELNTQRLNDLKTALDDLEIIDVRRKPEGLGADLRASDEFMKSQESMLSLMEQGFYVVPGANNQADLLSENGEIHVGMKDGVEYVLRFGRPAGVDTRSTEGKLNRYLFVTARLDMSKIPAPELEELPPADDAAPKPDDAGAKPTDAEKPAETEKPAGDQPAPNKDGAEKDAAAESDDAKSDDQKPADDLEAKSEAQRERERIEKENQRKLDDYNEKKAAAEKKVDELQDRFADWYYIISEDVYKKIHLGRGDIIKESQAAQDEGFGVDAFRKLESEGLKKSEEGNDQAPMTNIQ